MITRCLVPLSFVLALASCKTATLGPTSPYGGTPHEIPGTIETEHYDEGAPEEAYHDVDEKNHGADYRGVTHVDIEKRPDASSGHGIGWTQAGEWLVYTVHVKESGTYKAEFPVASAKKGGTFHLEIEGADVSGPIEIPDTGSWQKLETITRDGIRLEKGVYVMKIVMDTDGESGGVGDIDYVRFTKVD